MISSKDNFVSQVSPLRGEDFPLRGRFSAEGGGFSAEGGGFSAEGGGISAEGGGFSAECRKIKAMSNSHKTLHGDPHCAANLTVACSTC